MNITVVRLKDDGAATLGRLYIGAHFECYTLEDTYRETKIPKITRIPAGEYEITLRTFGGHHERYSIHRNDEIRAMHRGMLWVRDVPKFTDILHHIGNYVWDTSGCLLVGKAPSKDKNGHHCVLHSTAAYISYYRQVVGEMLAGNKVMIRYLDADRS